MTLEVDLAATAQTLIHKPVPEVFDAFVNPETMSRFWFTRRDDGLRAGETSAWYLGARPDAPQFEVRVTSLVHPRSIVMEWEKRGEPHHGDVEVRAEESGHNPSPRGGDRVFRRSAGDHRCRARLDRRLQSSDHRCEGLAGASRADQRGGGTMPGTDSREFFDYGGTLYVLPMGELPYWRVHMTSARSNVRTPAGRNAVARVLGVRTPRRRRGPGGTSRVTDGARIAPYPPASDCANM